MIREEKIAEIVRDVLNDDMLKALQDDDVRVSRISKAIAQALSGICVEVDTEAAQRAIYEVVMQAGLEEVDPRLVQSIALSVIPAIASCLKTRTVEKVRRECTEEQVKKLFRNAALANTPDGTLPDWIHFCANCGRISDGREAEGGGDEFGAAVDDDRWACSSECWDALVEPQPPETKE